MPHYLETWLELRTDRRAVTALEYALMAASSRLPSLRR